MRFFLKYAAIVEAAKSLKVREHGGWIFDAEPVDPTPTDIENKSLSDRANRLAGQLQDAEAQVAALRSALLTLRVAVNDKQPDPGAVNFIDKALSLPASELGKATSDLIRAISKLWSVNEDYPHLKSSQAIAMEMDLSDEVTKCLAAWQKAGGRP